MKIHTKIYAIFQQSAGMSMIVRDVNKAIQSKAKAINRVGQDQGQGHDIQGQSKARTI